MAQGKSNAQRQKEYRARVKAKQEAMVKALIDKAGDDYSKEAIIESMGPVRMGTAQKRLPYSFPRWLKKIAEGVPETTAAKDLGHTVQTLRKYTDASAERRLRYQAALEDHVETIEAEAHRRGVEGYDEVTTNGDGEVTRVVHRYDSQLLQLRLKALRPERYRESHGGSQQPTVIVLQSAFSAVRPQADIELQPVELPPGEDDA